MTAKEYLEQVENIDYRIKSLAMQKRRLKNKCLNNDRIYELEQDIERAETYYIELQRKVTAEINSMNNHVYATILSMRYLSGATWGEIAQFLGYKDVKYVRTILCEKALNAFQNSPSNPLLFPLKI